MFRAFLIAIGISICIIGGECLVVDQAVIAYPNRTKGKASKSHYPFGQQSNGRTARDAGIARRKIKPPEWAPWSLLSGGVVVALYAVSVQRE